MKFKKFKVSMIWRTPAFILAGMLVAAYGFGFTNWQTYVILGTMLAIDLLIFE